MSINKPIEEKIVYFHLRWSKVPYFEWLRVIKRVYNLNYKESRVFNNSKSVISF